MKQIEAKLSQNKKDKPKGVPSNPKAAQHAMLLEEIKVKQKKMLSKQTIDDATQDEEKSEKKEPEKPSKPQPSNPPRAPSPPPGPSVEFSSKIISKSKVLSQTQKETSHVKAATSALTNGITITPTNIRLTNPTTKPSTTTTTTSKPYTNTTTIKPNTTAANTISAAGITKSRVSIGGFPSKLPVSKTLSGPPNKEMSTAARAAIFETQQWSERSRGSGSVNKRPSPDVPSKPRPHSATTTAAIMKEFRPEEKPSQANLKPPSAYFDSQKKPSAGKPLVSISAYPSPSHRPTPVKMDFLPSAKIEVNGVNVGDSHATKDVLQNELKSTLTRSNLRQRSTVGNVFEGPIPPAASSASTSTTTKPSFTTTTIVNTATPPKASLSSKYGSIGNGTKEQQ